jgi:ABC-2 type transport system ATP-binding protein
LVFCYGTIKGIMPKDTIDKADTKTVVQVEHLQKKYGSTEVVCDISFSIREGEVSAFLGPNGAGKSTTLNLLMGLRRPDGGRIEILGYPPGHAELKTLVGATPQDLDFPPALRVFEVIQFVRFHYPHPLGLNDVCERFQLGKVWHKQLGVLSGGERRRVGLACAFTGRPRLVFLDEPTTGVDVESRRAVWAQVQEFVREGVTILFTTHYLQEAEALADHVLFINHGRIVFEGDVEAVRAHAGLKRVSFECSIAMPDLSGLGVIETSSSQKTILTGDSDLVVRELVRREIPFRNLHVQPASLEEAFVALKGQRT